MLINIEEFISQNITKRNESLFEKDIQNNSTSLSAEIKGKSVLVIGGAGTIGSSFIKSILPFFPGKLVVVDYSENGLTELTRDLRSSFNQYIPKTYITYPFDFGGDVFAKMFLSNKFDIVACFAAHKHVRSEKDHFAIEAMINNNVVNTCKLLNLCLQNKPQHFFCVSTDKAANPVNVMGASKKLMENALLAYSSELKISTARFANVAFSNGSLLDGFIYRIAKRQPLSSPSDVKRYFVSPLESGQLCMLSCILGNSGDIFFPKLKEEQMMTFSSIAEKFLTKIGYSPDYSKTEEEARIKAERWNVDSLKYPVYFFESNTSGEKMYEEFFTVIDDVIYTRFIELGVINNPPLYNIAEVDDLLQKISNLFNRIDLAKTDVIHFLNSVISDFNHIETGKNLDQKM